MKYEAPPKSIKIDGIDYSIETDYRVWIGFSQKIAKLSDEELLNEILNFMAELRLPKTDEGLQAVLDFYSCGKKSNDGKKNAPVKQCRAFDFEEDEELIVAAFMSQYHINLRKKKLHWWDFIAMFKGLKDDEKICEIMAYRTMDISKIDKSQKAYYRALKEKYALDKVHYSSLEERDNALREKMKRIQKEVNGIG